MEEVYNFIKSSIGIKPGDAIVVGVSGGPDSMALLHILKSLKSDLDIRIICAHINHKKRKESEEEEEDVRNYCRMNDILFECLKIEKWGDDNFENEARIIRYKFFEEIRENCVKKVVYCRVDGRPFLLTNFNEDGATFTLVQRQGGVTTSRIAFVDSSNHWSLSASIELAKGSDVTQLQQDVYGIQQQLGDVDVTELQQQVDNVENDLAENYYRKEDTYDRDEVEEKIRAAIKDINYMTSNSSDPEDQDWLWGGD